MTCHELEGLWAPYLDGEFDGEARLEVERHLGGCPPCSKRAEFERRFRSELRHKVVEAATPAPAHLRARVRDGLRVQARRRTLHRALRISAAAGVLLAVGVGTLALAPRKLDSFLLDAARRHARVLPSEIHAPVPEEVEAWFHGKLDHRVRVPRFPNAQLSGARLSNVQDRPAAYIRYEQQGPLGGPRTLGLFVFGDEKNDLGVRPLPAASVESRLGYNVAVWRDGEIVYELVSDLDEADIRALLEAHGRLGPGDAAATQDLPGAHVRPLSLDR